MSVAQPQAQAQAGAEREGGVEEQQQTAASEVVAQARKKDEEDVAQALQLSEAAPQSMNFSVKEEDARAGAHGRQDSGILSFAVFRTE